MGYTLKIANSDRAKGDSFGYSMVLHDLHVFRQTQFTPSPTFFTFFHQLYGASFLKNLCKNPKIP